VDGFVPGWELERVEDPAFLDELVKQTEDVEHLGSESHHTDLRLTKHKDVGNLSQPAGINLYNKPQITLCNVIGVISSEINNRK
jgi:hypothetical protein